MKESFISLKLLTRFERGEGGIKNFGFRPNWKNVRTIDKWRSVERTLGKVK